MLHEVLLAMVYKRLPAMLYKGLPAILYEVLLAMLYKGLPTVSLDCFFAAVVVWQPDLRLQSPWRRWPWSRVPSVWQRGVTWPATLHGTPSQETEKMDYRRRRVDRHHHHSSGAWCALWQWVWLGVEGGEVSLYSEWWHCTESVSDPTQSPRPSYWAMFAVNCEEQDVRAGSS